MQPPDFVQGMKDGAEYFQQEDISAQLTLNDIITEVQDLFSPSTQERELAAQQVLGGDLPSDSHKIGFLLGWLNAYATSIC